MTRGHSASCADAVRTTPDECKCKCGGDFHGGPHTERVRALVWDHNKREKYSRTQVTTAKRKACQAIDAETSIGETCTDFAVTHMIDVFIAATSAKEQQVARETLKAVLDPFVEVIVDAELDSAASGYIETAVDYLHIICSFCVEVLKVVEKAKTLAIEMADEIAQSVVDSLGEQSFLTDLVKEVLKRALSRSLSPVIDLLADPAKVKMLQIVGFATCPNTKNHSEVVEFCVKPLEGEYVSVALHNWIDQNFPRGSDILKRRSRRKKVT